MIPHHSTHSEKLLSYLASGVTQSQAALALGITPSAVTQLIEQPEFSARLQELREEQLKRSSAIDEKYDSIEAKLLDQLEKTIPLLMRPGEIANVLTRVNQAKRRGSAVTAPQAPTQIIQLNLPVAIQNRFTLNSQNQVVQAGAQDLVTIPSSALTKLMEIHHETKEDEFGFTNTAAAGQGSGSSLASKLNEQVLTVSNTSKSE